MQTSTIMLDSTIDKILTTRQVDDRSSVNEVDNSNKRDEESEGNQSTRSEAEVRLVVRFIVEEQIVFKGKIERVNQLESEELSRVVSRVAWDGANDSSKSTSDGQNSLAQKKASVEFDEKPMQPKSQTQTSSSSSKSLSSTVAPNQLKENASASKGNKQADLVQERSASNDDSSDHQACIKSYPLISEIADGCEDLPVAQVERHLTPGKSVTKKDCDIDSERPVNHICETDHQYLQISPLIQEPNGQDSRECDSIDLNFDTDLPNLIDHELANDILAESQSVADALNECVNSVDRESKRANEYNSTNGAQIQDDKQEASSLTSKQDIVFVSNGIIKKAETCLEYPVKEVITKQKISILETSEESENKRDFSRENPTEIEDQLKQSRDHKSSASKETVHKEESIGPSSGKRKTIGEHSSTGKRIRRIAAKDQRNQTRTSANKVTQYSQAQQTATINRLESGSLLADNQHSRQNKVFAKWTDNHFYPGTILDLTRDRKFLIGFFDGAQRSVAETDIIPLRNIEGKQVRMSIAKNYCVNAIVHNQLSPVSDQPMFDVEYQQHHKHQQHQQGGSVRECVPLQDIFLTGDQGAPLISQPDKNSGVSNFADVDLDNIIYEKRSRRLQEMEDFELTENTSSGNKRKRGQHGMRNTNPRVKSNNTCSSSPTSIQGKSHDEGIQDSESIGSPDTLKASFLCPNSNPPSESSSPTGSSNVSNVLELNQEFYFSSSSPHRTKTSLLL